MSDISGLANQAQEIQVKEIYARYAARNPALKKHLEKITPSNIKFLQDGRLSREELNVILAYAKEKGLPVLESPASVIEPVVAEAPIVEAASRVAKTENWFSRQLGKVKDFLKKPFGKKPAPAPVVVAVENTALVNGAETEAADHSRFMPQGGEKSVSPIVAEEHLDVPKPSEGPAIMFEPPSTTMREVTTENGITQDMVVNEPSSTALISPEAEKTVAAEAAVEKKSGGIWGWVKEQWNKLFAKNERLAEAERLQKDAKKLGRNAKKEAGAAEKILGEASHMSSGKKWALGLTAAAAVGAWAAYANEGKKLREAEQRAGRR